MARKDEVVKLRIPADEKKRWDAAARAAGMTLSAWLRANIDDMLKAEGK